MKNHRKHKKSVKWSRHLWSRGHTGSLQAETWHFCRRHQTLTNHPRKKQKHFLFLHFKHPGTLFSFVFFHYLWSRFRTPVETGAMSDWSPLLPTPLPTIFPPSVWRQCGSVQSFSLCSGCRLSPLSNTNQTQNWTPAAICNNQVGWNETLMRRFGVFMLIKTPAHLHLLYFMKETIEMPASHSIKLFLGFIFPGGPPVETPKCPPKIAMRRFTESRIPQDESHKSSRSRANEFWICRRDQEGFRHELWIWQKFRVL